MVMAILSDAVPEIMARLLGYLIPMLFKRMYEEYLRRRKMKRLREFCKAYGVPLIALSAVVVCLALYRGERV